MDLDPTLLGEGHVDQDVLFGVIQESSQLRSNLIGDLAPLRLRGGGVVLGKGGRNEGGGDASATHTGMSQA